MTYSFENKRTISFASPRVKASASHDAFESRAATAAVVDVSRTCCYCLFVISLFPPSTAALYLMSTDIDRKKVEDAVRSVVKEAKRNDQLEYARLRLAMSTGLNACHEGH
jgi:hypothetical protein